MNNRHNTLLLTVIGVATLLVAVIGASFAYFTAELSGKDKEESVKIGAGKLAIAYADSEGNTVDVDGMIPKEEEPVAVKKFTITGNNNTTAIMPYNIKLNIINNEFSNGVLKYTFKSENTSDNGQVAPSVENETDIASGNDFDINLGNARFVGSVDNAIHSYTLKIYFPETFEPQNDEKGKEFKSKVEIGVDEIINQ